MSSPATFETFQREIARLVDKFDRDYPQFVAANYNEPTLRNEFLDPFFRALGWDVGNINGLIHTEREVDIEVRTVTSGRQTRADYVFRYARVERFTCEAKKPAEPLHDRHIFQAKRDAFNRGIPFALLSDFEELKIYIVGARPHRDEPHVGEFKTLNYRQYPLAARELWDLLGYDSVRAGSLDREIARLPKRPLRIKGKQGYLIKPDRTRALDVDFLNFLDDARQQLGSDLLKHNDRDDLLEGHRLNEAAQRIIDRLIFLRICEDRGIDTGTLLQTLFNDWLRQQTQPPGLRRPGRQSHLRLGGGTDGSNVVGEEPAALSGRGHTDGTLYREIVDHIRAVDHRPASHKPHFNGQLFAEHFSENLVIGDEWLSNFILDLTDDDTGYNFASIKVEILGDAYERFLGKILRPQGRGATVEEKPEVRKAGGVYYTPRFITDYIVEQTIGRLLDGKSPREVEKLRFVDPACGSGSFLIRAYERVMEHHLRWFIANPEKQKKADCYVDAAGNVRLTTALKRHILTNNIYGVDIDSQAVEVAQFSLYLKMLEDENRDTLRQQTELFRGEPLLPPLDKNIRCFNSLISSDFSPVPAEIAGVGAGDWEVQFPAIMSAGGFDAVIGNPPYLNIDDTWGKGDLRLLAIKDQYPQIYNDKTDLLFYFIAKGLKLSRGQVGLIVSRSFLEAFKADKLRGHLAAEQALAEIVDFQNFHVFEGVGIATCIIRLEKTGKGKHVDIFKLRTPQLRSTELREVLGNRNDFEHLVRPRSSLSSASWSFVPPQIAELNTKIDAAGGLLGNILRIGQGMQTGCNEVFGARTLAEMHEWKTPGSLFRFRAANSDIQRFEIRDRQEVLLYLEDEESFDALPIGVQRHLTKNADKLKARAAYKRRNCDWWRFTWPLHREYYDRERLICPFLASENRFAFVADGKFIGLTDTTVLFEKGQPESLKFLLGLLNSRLLTFRFRSIGKLKGGGVYEYFWNSISKLPIRRINFSTSSDKATHDRIVALVDKMLLLMPALRLAKNEAERRAVQNATAKIDRDIDQLVYQLYALTPEEIALVEGAGAPATAEQTD